MLTTAFFIHSLLLIPIGLAIFVTVRESGVQPLWRALGVGVALQVGVGMLQVIRQETGFLTPLGMVWPGDIDSDTIGASVVALDSGARWLRAYGTTPHPNLLAGYLTVALAGPIGLFLQTRRVGWLLLVLAGTALLALTFSRTGWLAFAVVLVTLLWLLPHIARRGLITLFVSLFLLVILLLVLLLPLFESRVSPSAIANIPIEQHSIDDRWTLLRAGVSEFTAQPITGVGAGNYVARLVLDQQPYTPEPVHNVFVLALAEIGILGGLGLGLLLAAMALSIRQVRRSPTLSGAMMAAVVTSLPVSALFDHNLWSGGPGRLWAVIAFAFLAACSPTYNEAIQA